LLFRVVELRSLFDNIFENGRSTRNNSSFLGYFDPDSNCTPPELSSRPCSSDLLNHQVYNGKHSLFDSVQDVQEREDVSSITSSNSNAKTKATDNDVEVSVNSYENSLIGEHSLLDRFDVLHNTSAKHEDLKDTDILRVIEKEKETLENLPTQVLENVVKMSKSEADIDISKSLKALIQSSKNEFLDEKFIYSDGQNQISKSNANNPDRLKFTRNKSLKNKLNAESLYNVEDNVSENDKNKVQLNHNYHYHFINYPNKDEENLNLQSQMNIDNKRAENTAQSNINNLERLNSVSDVNRKQFQGLSNSQALQNPKTQSERRGHFNVRTPDISLQQSSYSSVGAPSMPSFSSSSQFQSASFRGSENSQFSQSAAYGFSPVPQNPQPPAPPETTYGLPPAFPQPSYMPPPSNPIGQAYGPPVANPQPPSYIPPPSSPPKPMYGVPVANPQPPSYIPPPASPPRPVYSPPVADPQPPSYYPPPASPPRPVYYPPAANPQPPSYIPPPSSPPKQVYGPPVFDPQPPSYIPPAPSFPRDSYGPPPPKQQSPLMNYGPPALSDVGDIPFDTRFVLVNPSRKKRKRKKHSGLKLIFGGDSSQFDNTIFADDLNYGLRNQRDSLRDEFWENRERLQRQEMEVFELKQLKSQIKAQEKQREALKRGFFREMISEGFGGGIRDMLYKGATTLGAMALVPITNLTLDPGSWTLDLRPWTLNPGPWTLDPGPWTLDPSILIIYASRLMRKGNRNITFRGQINKLCILPYLS
ncbi:hypothetical protein Anas_04897, partial [Armadillidium nasatum]